MFELVSYFMAHVLLETEPGRVLVGDENGDLLGFHFQQKSFGIGKRFKRYM